jgi:hypothetical protein
MAGQESAVRGPRSSASPFESLKNIAARNQKLLTLLQEWSRRGLIRVYGRAQIALRSLPKQCQDEWMQIYEAPIQKHIFSDANKQIREAKQCLRIPDAKGVVLIANEGHIFPSTADLLTYVARILKKKNVTAKHFTPVFTASFSSRLT